MRLTYQFNNRSFSDAAIDGDELDQFRKTDRTLFAKIGYGWLP